MYSCRRKDNIYSNVLLCIAYILWYEWPIRMILSWFFREFVGLLKRRRGAESEAASAC